MGAKKSDRFDEVRGIEEIDNLDERYANPTFTDEEIRENLKMNYKDPGDVDIRRKPDNMVYAWGRETVKGMIDPEGVVDKARQGWTPVPLSRHPEFWIPDSIDGGESRKSGIIRHKGNILFERDIKYHKIAEEIAQKQNFEAMDAISQMEKETGIDPRFITPGLRRNSVSISRERGFG
jgi:hypothetical protein